MGAAILSTFRKTAVISGDPLIFSRKRGWPLRGLHAHDVCLGTLHFGRVRRTPRVSEHSICQVWVGKDRTGSIFRGVDLTHMGVP